MDLRGVIDLGSNSVRLVVYEVKIEGGHGGHVHFHSILDDKRMAGLAAYVVEGYFTKEGVQRAIQVLDDLLGSARDVQCKHVDIFATAVLRNARNSAEVVAEIEKGCDHKIHLIAEEDEAHLGFVGATWGNPLKAGTLIDIGGGSTELTNIRPDGDHHNVSLPQGSVSSYAEFVRLVLPSWEEQQDIRACFRGHLSTLPSLSFYEHPHMFGIGGSVRAVQKMHALLYDDGVKPDTVDRASLASMLELLNTDPSKFAHAAVKAVPDRVHTLVPGALITLELMEEFGAEELTICKHGIREGYLLERMLKL